MRVKKHSSVAFVFQLFLTIQGKTMAALLWLFSDFCSKALQYIIEYNHAHTPGPAWPAHAAESGPRARLQVLQNSGSRMFMFRVKTLSARDRHWRNPRKKNYRERSNIKSACVSALTGSVPRKTATGLQRVSAPCGNRTQVARLSATHL